jgi:hypothetical protein
LLKRVGGDNQRVFYFAQKHFVYQEFRRFAGFLLFSKIFGIENNIYMQIGLIMLVGLLSKTAILITEYTAECRKSGQTIKLIFAKKFHLKNYLRAPTFCRRNML